MDFVKVLLINLGCFLISSLRYCKSKSSLPNLMMSCSFELTIYCIKLLRLLVRSKCWRTAMIKSPHLLYTTSTMRSTNIYIYIYNQSLFGWRLPVIDNILRVLISSCLMSSVVQSIIPIVGVIIGEAKLLCATTLIFLRRLKYFFVILAFTSGHHMLYFRQFQDRYKNHLMVVVWLWDH